MSRNRSAWAAMLALVLGWGGLATAEGAKHKAAPKAKSVEKENDWDVVTLESGALAKISVPKSLKKGQPGGLIVTLHGHGGEPNQMLGYGRALSEHRGDIWCAYRASSKVGDDNYAYDSEKDLRGIVEMTRYVLANYKIDPKRVFVHGFSAGGAMGCRLVPANRDLYTGLITCAAPDAPGLGSGGDVKGLRAVVFLGDQDQNFSLAPDVRRATDKLKPNLCFTEVAGLGHDLPDAIYLNDAINFLVDGTEKGGIKQVPLVADHEMAKPKGVLPPPPDYFHVYLGWKATGAAAGVTRTKQEAKALADSWLDRLKKGEATLADALADSDDEATKADRGWIDPDAMKKFGQKLADKAKTLKADTWELIETARGYHLLHRAKE